MLSEPSAPDEAAKPSDPVGPVEFKSPPADIVVAEVRIENFRALANVVVPLNEGPTYLVGENNSGKSSVLLAIATACGGRRPIQDDLRQESGSSSEMSVIDLILRSTASEFSKVVAQRLEANYGPGPGPGEWTGIRTSLSFSRESSFLVARKTFLRWNVSEQRWEDSEVQVSLRAGELILGQLVGASRDLIDDLSARGSDWGRVLADLGVPESERQVLQEELLNLGGRLQVASPVLTQLGEHLSRVAEAQAGIMDISLRPLPIRIEELARAVDIVVSSLRGEELPLRFQGLGMRSLAALMVFRSLCDLRLGADLGIRPHIMTLLEEPEAHLHPQAQAAVRTLIEELPGQAVVATHSDVLVAEADPRAVRVLRVSIGGTQAFSLDFHQAKKVAVFRRYVERPLGELFFARFVIFVDGTAERISLPPMLDVALGRSCTGYGITVVDMEGMNRDQLEKAIEALAALGGVPWIVFLDNDSDGWKAIEGVKGSDGVELHKDHPQVVVSGDKQLEALLLDAEYGPEVQEIANAYLPRDERDPRFPEERLPDSYAKATHDDYLAFLADNKGWAAELVVRKAALAGKPMPASVTELSKRVTEVIEAADADAGGAPTEGKPDTEGQD